MTPPLPLARRAFLKQSGLAAATVAAPLILPSGLRGANAPSNKITVGIVGSGNIADSHYGKLLGEPETVRIVAVNRGQENRNHLRVTIVYAKRDGRWQMVAWQSTRIPQS